jgi:Ni/Co efflux regulator RcnB
MKPVALKMKGALVLVIGAIFVASPVMADPPSWAGAGKGGKEKRTDRGDKGRASAQRGHFEERHRVIVRDYYAEQFRAGRCPPGLAKKQNGCMPPGQAKKWRLGRPLPRDVIFYEVPQSVVVQIGLPPPGYRYVRVASDILLIAIGTGMIIDAIEDLGR